jgi:hypothetical protein
MNDGRVFELFDPDPSMIKYRDMVNALAKECRYGNRCKTHYSVAQHSVLAANLALHLWPENHHAAMCALMHDCAEYLMCDSVTSMKKHTFFYDDRSDRYVSFKEVEVGVMACISAALGVPVYDDETTPLLDGALLYRELQDLTGIDPQAHYPEYAELGKQLPPIQGWSWELAGVRFHDTFKKLATKLDLEPPKS